MSFSKIMDALRWIMRPATAQLPLFAISFVLLAANPFYCLLKAVPKLIRGTWTQSMSLALIYLSLALLMSYLIALMAYVVKQKWFKVALYSLVFILFGVYCFVQLNFHSIITPTIMMAMAETNESETHEFFSQFAFSWQSIVTYVVVAIVIITSVMLERRHSRKMAENGDRRVPVLILLAIVGGLVYGVMNTKRYYELESVDFLSDLEKSKTFSRSTFAMDIVSDWLFCLKAMESSKNEVDRSINSTISALKQPIYTQEDSLTIIVVIGESYIKSHAGIYGYNLNTTPHMRELEQKGQLVAFTNCISPYNTTNISLKNALSTNSIGNNEEWYDTPYWPSLLAKAHFTVTMWDNQYSFSPLAGGGSLDALLYNDEVSKATYIARNKKAFEFDGDLVADYFKQMAETGIDNRPKRLAMFHLMGQHVKPQKRYTEPFDVFKADNPAYAKWPKFQAQYRSEYDNATLYNDHVINTLANHYANTCAIMVYFSDHGEEAYDFRDNIGRQNDPVKTKEILHCQNDVPLVVWHSDSFAKKHPDIVQRIRQAAPRPMMIDLLGYMVLGMAKVDTPVYRSDRDVLSPEYRCPPRITYNNVDYDKVCK